MQLLYSSELTVRPDHWNPKREEIKAKLLIDPVDRAEFNRNVNNHKALIMDLYNAAPDKSVLTSEWLKTEMQKKLHPVVQTHNTSKSFFEDFDYFLSTRRLSDVRIRNFRVLYRALQRFEYYRRLNVYKKFTLKYESVAPDILREFETFLRQEYTFFNVDEEMVSRYVYVNISLPMTLFLKPVLRNNVVRIPLTIFLQNFAHSSVGLGKAVRPRTIRSIISLFRNVYMERHIKSLLKRGTNYIIRIWIIIQHWQYTETYSYFSA